MKRIKRFWLADWKLLVFKIYYSIPVRFRMRPAAAGRLAAQFLNRRFFTDALYRTEALLFPCLAVNLLCAAIQLMIGFAYRSVWSGALAVYYVMLAVMRVQLLKPMKHDEEEGAAVTELRRYRLCGMVLLCMTPFFASIMILVIHESRLVKYRDFTIAVLAVYAFCRTAVSFSNFLKFKRYRRPEMSAAKLISLIAAMMSVLSFVTAFIARIEGQNGAFLRKGLLGTVGGAVCVFVLFMAVYMLVYASKQLKQFSQKTELCAALSVSNSLNKAQIR